MIPELLACSSLLFPSIVSKTPDAERKHTEVVIEIPESSTDIVTVVPEAATGELGPQLHEMGAQANTTRP